MQHRSWDKGESAMAGNLLVLSRARGEVNLSGVCEEVHGALVV